MSKPRRPDRAGEEHLGRVEDHRQAQDQLEHTSSVARAAPSPGSRVRPARSGPTAQSVPPKPRPPGTGCAHRAPSRPSTSHRDRRDPEPRRGCPSNRSPSRPSLTCQVHGRPPQRTGRSRTGRSRGGSDSRRPVRRAHVIRDRLPPAVVAAAPDAAGKVLRPGQGRPASPSGLRGAPPPCSPLADGSGSPPPHSSRSPSATR